MLQLLKELTDCRGVSGNENEIRAALRKLAEERGAHCFVDRMGNLLAQKDGGDASAPHILLAAHMDEVGMIVTGIQDDGLLRYRPVGSIDSRVMVSKPVSCGEKRVPGVIGAKAIHLQSKADSEHVLGHDQLYIDIGAKTKAEAEKLCPRGTYVTFDSPLIPHGEGMVTGRALDDRVGCHTLLCALAHGYRGKLTCAFTVQEEVGLRGATVISHSLDNDLAIVLEGTASNDLGDIPFEKQVCCVMGGVAISAMDNTTIAHPGLKAAVEAVAKRAGIPHQQKRYISGGNDAGPLQHGAKAKPTVVLSVPCRYIHSPSSVAAESDIRAQADLVNAFIDALPTAWASICK